MSTGEDQTRYYVPATLHRALDLLPMLQAVSTGLDLLQPWISTDKRYVQLPLSLLPTNCALNPLRISVIFLPRSCHLSTKFASRV